MPALYKLFLLLERQRVWNKWTGSAAKKEQGRKWEKMPRNISLYIKRERVTRLRWGEEEERMVYFPSSRLVLDASRISKEEKESRGFLWRTTITFRSFSMLQAFFRAMCFLWLEAQTRPDIYNFVYCSAAWTWSSWSIKTRWLFQAVRSNFAPAPPKDCPSEVQGSNELEELTSVPRRTRIFASPTRFLSALYPHHLCSSPIP